ncbi:chromatin modification-related protein EAF1 [Cyclospora cayetanensis]|uniref:Chromatin modification-related protein EAF1 n=1 Tax=Cyclospora cayetanensis TaxID=88456 RepID=A0A6P6RQ32_9EIME|nr:chromatin modification-related protein EAF1 [Cyclospora cayetanensis]
MPVPKAGMGEKQRLAVIFNCLLHACERQGDALGGFEVYRQMKATGAPPDEATFHSVAALLERSGEQHGMLKLLEHMQAEGHEPSLAVLSLAVTCCSRAGAADAALHLSQQLRRRIRTAAAAAAPTAAVGVAPWTAGLEKEDEGIRAAATALQQALPSSVYAALVSGCAAAGRHEKALHLYGELASLKGYQELLQRRLAQKAQNTQQEQQQQLEPETLQHLQQLLRRDSYLPKAQVVNAAVAAAAATGRLQLALSFYRRDLLRQQEQQVQHGEDHFAEDTLGSLSGGEAYAPTTETFLLLLTAAAAQQSSSTVDILLRDFEQQQLLRQQQQLPPLDAPAIHAAAAEALAAGGRWREGLQLLVHSHADRQRQQHQAIQQLQHLISTQQQLRQEEQQLNRIQPMLQQFPPAGSVIPYLALLRSCAAAGAPREALGVLRLLQQRQQQQQHLYMLQQQLQQDEVLSAAAAVPPELPLNAFAEVMAAAAAAADWQLVLSVAAEFESPKVQQQVAAGAVAATAAAATAFASSATEERLPQHTAATANVDGAAAAAAAASAAAALSQQPIPLELRLRIASLKLMGLLHTRQSLAAARQREHLLHLIEKSSSRGARPVQRGSGVPQSIEGLHQELQPVAINDALTEDVLKLAENMLGPPVQEHHPQRATPLLHPHERERLEEQQRQRHREMVLEQIRQHEQQPRTHNPHSE